MAKLPACRFTMSNGTARRCVISVFESARQDVYVNLRANSAVRELGQPIVRGADGLPEALRITNHKVSIHPSREAAGVNVLKFIQVRDDGTETTIRQFTAALKRDNGFALVYARRLTALNTPEHDLERDDGQSVYMGAFNPALFTPFIAVFVGPKDRRFERPATWPFQVFQQVFTDVRLVVCLAYFTVTAHESGAVQVGSTTPDGGPSAGRNEVQCADLFARYANVQRDELAETVGNLLGARFGQFVAHAALVKFPDQRSQSYLAWQAECQRLGLRLD